MQDFYEQPDTALKQRRLAEYTTGLIRPLFPKDRSVKILDIGSGYGLFLDACQKAGYANVEGVEMVSTFAEYSRHELGLRHVTTSDVFTFFSATKDESFDVITALNIVEHIEKQKVPELLTLIYKKLKPGGMLIMEVPNADSPLGVHTYFSDLTHQFAFSKKLGVTLLRMAGFATSTVRYQPNLRNPLIKLAQRILAKVVGFDAEAMFSGNVIFIGYKK